MDYPESEGYIKVKEKKINSRLTITVYKYKNKDKENIVKLDHFMLNDPEAIFLKKSTLEQVVKQLRTRKR